ncbi:MAG: hypothetical protein HKN12_08560 [Gemmatimonadetes bacterium]|nr:hypothetical protein [Gemmatimonadota bacterium]
MRTIPWDRVLAAALLPVVLAPGVVSALERASSILDPNPPEWSTAATATIAYYNNCTGWFWTWENLRPGEQFGMVFDTGNLALIQTTALLTYGTFASGYGFTGTISVTDVDASDVPTTVRASQPFAPVPFTWTIQTWNMAPPESRAALRVTWPPTPTGPTDIHLVTDHPALGPTGPTACGTCYPTTRTAHSYRWGTAAAPLVPGDPFFDGSCDAELVWEITVTQTSPTDQRSWGAVKALYR